MGAERSAGPAGIFPDALKETHFIFNAGDITMRYFSGRDLKDPATLQYLKNFLSQRVL